jgi:hypothetical protein
MSFSAFFFLFLLNFYLIFEIKSVFEKNNYDAHGDLRKILKKFLKKKKLGRWKKGKINKYIYIYIYMGKNKNEKDGVKMKFSNFSLGSKNTSPTFWGSKDT